MPNVLYPVPWLECRYPFDLAARNPELLKKINILLPAHTEVYLLDLGAGNGSNFLSLRFRESEKWTLLEIDPVLCDELRKLPGSPEVICGSLLDAEKLTDLKRFDLVTANAVFDLFSEDQFRQLAQALFRHNCKVYFSINYTGMDFFPQHTIDKTVISLYADHMQRKQEFGQAMGPDGPFKMGIILKEAGYQHIENGDSHWRVKGTDSAMLGYLLGFMRQALGELSVGAEEQRHLDEWFELRKKQMKDGKLEISVYHQDLLAW